MTILDRYLSRSFLGVLLFSFVAFICIFIIVDGIEKLDVYIEQDVPKFIVGKIYLYYIPYIIVLTLPVAMLLSSLFSVGTMARNNEIIAMKASGLSLYRILAPVFIIAMLVSLGALAFGEYVVPRASASRAELMTQYMEKRRQAYRRRLNNVYARDALDRRVSMRSFDAEKNTGFKVNIRKLDGLHLSMHTYAERMAWEDREWVLYQGVERLFEGDQEKVVRFERKVLADCNLLPEHFSKVLKKPEEMSYQELRTFIAEVERNGGDPNNWLVDLYLKISIPFANFIIVLFGAPLSSPKRRSGTATGFGISLAICFIYFGIVKTSQSLGQNGMFSPMFAAWIANAIFLVAGLIVLFRAHK